MKSFWRDALSNVAHILRIELNHSSWSASRCSSLACVEVTKDRREYDVSPIIEPRGVTLISEAPALHVICPLGDILATVYSVTR